MISEMNITTMSTDQPSVSGMYQPRSTLIAPTKARIHDRMAWETQLSLTHRERYYVAPKENDTYVPSDSLMATTAARANDSRAWSEHVQLLSSPPKIKSNLAPVKEHVLRLTKARVEEIFLLQEMRRLKELANHPSPPRYLLSTFMPSSHLLSSTKARELDALAWSKAKEQAAWQFSAEVVMKLPPLSEHLLAPTKSQVAAMEAWAVQKEQAKFADDIWWELRRPTPCSEYHHKFADNLPSKVSEVTVSFSLSMRHKYIDEQTVLVEKQTKIGIALSNSRKNMPKIDRESHLLTTTKAATQCSWTTAVTHPAKIVDIRQLDLPSQISYPAQKLVRSKIYSETAATRHHRWQIRSATAAKKSIRPIVASESAQRLLRPTRAILQQQTAIFAGHHEDAREKKWNVHTTRARAMKENPFEEEWRPLTRTRRYAKTASKVFTTPLERKHSMHGKRHSFTSTEVRAAVAKAVQAALAEATTMRKPPQSKKSSKKPASVASKTAMPNKTPAKKLDVVLPTVRSQALQSQIEAMMMLSPVATTRAQKNASGMPLVFEDLSDCISPMSTFDVEEEEEEIKQVVLSRHQSLYAIVLPDQPIQEVDEAFVHLNLSAATVDQDDHEAYETRHHSGSYYRLSLETSKYMQDETQLPPKVSTHSLKLGKEIIPMADVAVVDVTDEDTVVMDVAPRHQPVDTMLLLA